MGKTFEFREFTTFLQHVSNTVERTQGTNGVTYTIIKNQEGRITNNVDPKNNIRITVEHNLRNTKKLLAVFEGYSST